MLTEQEKKRIEEIFYNLRNDLDPKGKYRNSFNMLMLNHIEQIAEIDRLRARVAELESHLSPQVVVTTKEAWEKIDSIKEIKKPCYDEGEPCECVEDSDPNECCFLVGNDGEPTYKTWSDCPHGGKHKKDGDAE